MTAVFSQQGATASPCPADWRCQPRHRGARSGRLRNQVCHREPVRQAWLRNKMGCCPVTPAPRVRRSVHHTAGAFGLRCSPARTHVSGTVQKEFDFKAFFRTFPASRRLPAMALMPWGADPAKATPHLASMLLL